MSEPYAKGVTMLRWTLVHQATGHHELVQTYLNQHMAYPKDAPETAESKLISAAVMGNAMADTYASALAGLLGLIEDQYGEDAANELCVSVALMLNGELEDANDDVEIGTRPTEG